MMAKPNNAPTPIAMVKKVDKRAAEQNHSVKVPKAYKPWKSGMMVKRRVPVYEADGKTKVTDKNGKVEYEEQSKKITADKKSEMNHLYMSASTQAHWKTLWSEADGCSLFRQKVDPVKNDAGEWVNRTRVLKNGKVVEVTERSNHALSSHTFRTLLSGAVAAVNAQMHADSMTLRLQHENKEPLAPEDPRYPMLPTIQVGAAYAIEAAFIAYVQEIFSVAREIQQAHGKKHDKVTPRCAQAAAEIVNKKLASATSFVPESVAFRKPPVVTAKKVTEPAKAAEP